MGNSGGRARAPALLGKTHVPDFEWKVRDFSALLEMKATSATSGPFQCSGYKWYLQVSPMHKNLGGGTPYVALNLILSRHTFERGHTVHAVFEFSIYNHSNGMYCGCKVLVEKKATTVQNLFVQKKGFIKGTYTWTMNNFPELDLKHFVCSPTFEVGGHKWYIGMYPRGDKHSTDCLSLFLYMDSSNELPLESRNLVEMTLTIEDQKNGKHISLTSDPVVLASGWGWPDFIPLKKFKDPSRGYLVESNCIVKADFTIVGSSNAD